MKLTHEQVSALADHCDRRIREHSVYQKEIQRFEDAKAVAKAVTDRVCSFSYIKKLEAKYPGSIKSLRENIRYEHLNQLKQKTAFLSLPYVRTKVVLYAIEAQSVAVLIQKVVDECITELFLREV